MSSTIDPQLQSATSMNGEAAANDKTSLFFQTSDSKFWRGGAPKKAAGPHGWPAWSRHLAERASPVPVSRLCGAKGTALAWGVNPAELSAPTFEFLQLEAQETQESNASLRYGELLGEWLAGSDSSGPASVGFALECLAVANLLPRVASAIEEDLWWGVADALAQIVEQIQDWQIDASADPQQALAHQLLAGELPLTLAYLFPEIRPLYRLRTTGQDAIAEGLTELLNGAGLPRASLLPVFRALVASWTRSRAMSQFTSKGGWSTKAEEQFRYAVTRALMLSTTSGHGLLCGEEVLPWSPDFLAAMLREGGDEADRTAAFDSFKKKLTTELPGKSAKRVPDCSESCEWAELAVLRSDWNRKEAVLAVDYSQPEMRIDVWVGAQRLFFGAWSTESIVGGKGLAAVGPWEETCWFSDKDVDYIELAVDLERGARLERQIALARNDRFLLLVDNVMNVPGEGVEHRLALPMCAGVGFVPEAETREGILMADKPRARVLPIGLPEWRTDPRIGELTAEGDRLQITHHRPGRNLSCPLFIDLEPKRLDKECTWRQLTVAQSLEIQPHEVAVGYRVQCGKAQWLMYRSMGEIANRTLLGYNLAIEAMIGRFLAPSGEVEELLQIEG